MYNILSTILTILLIPLWLPVVIWLAISYNWKDTVPKNTAKGDNNE